MLSNSGQEKKSGILLHISSIPSDYGIGSFGKRAYEFVDFLNKSKQQYWQILPLCPIGDCNSPYDTTSAFAGEILFIDIELLVKDGLLSEKDLPARDEYAITDYRSASKIKLPLLKKAVKEFDARDNGYLQFLHKNEYWINDYALFMAVKDDFGGIPPNKFDEGIKYRLPRALEHFRINHKQEINFYKITQFLFYKQYYALKNYAAKKKVKIIGDLPFYISFNSADLWKNPDIFRLGRDMTPVLVAGVPASSEYGSGKILGYPVYDWEYLKKTDYNWWRRRLKHNFEMYDILRIDRFGAFTDYYTVPYGAKDAASGKWEKGAGTHFWNRVKSDLPYFKIIAENIDGKADEGDTNSGCIELPEVRVMQYGFNGNLDNENFPKNYNRNCICYTGTFNDDTITGWLDKMSAREKIIFEKSVPGEKTISPVYRLISSGMKSKAELVLVPFQDYLQMGSESRMNNPQTRFGNWQWRYSENSLTKELSENIKKMSRGRNKK